MSRLLLVLALAACSGTPIPQHNGYRSTKAKPWKKFTTLKFDEKLEAKAEGDLSYRELRRAAWFAVDLPSSGELAIKLEVTPTGDVISDAFDLGLEVLDAGYRSVMRKDLDEGDSQQDLNKAATLKDLTPGRYWVHLYLQGRQDAADYIMRLAFQSGALSEGKSDFPAQVASIGQLPLVPLTDDTPSSYKPPPTPVKKQKKPPPPPPPAAAISARIIGVSVGAGGTKITVGRGTATGAAAGMRGKIEGIANGGFVLAACGERACTATLPGVTPDMLKSAGKVMLSP
jgi:hypothetical protein